MSVMNYIAVTDRIKKDVMDAKVVRGMFPCSDHYAVMTNVKAQD